MAFNTMANYKLYFFSILIILTSNIYQASNDQDHLILDVYIQNSINNKLFVGNLFLNKTGNYVFKPYASFDTIIKIIAYTEIAQLQKPNIDTLEQKIINSSPHLKNILTYNNAVLDKTFLQNNINLYLHEHDTLMVVFPIDVHNNFHINYNDALIVSRPNQSGEITLPNQSVIKKIS